MTANVETRQEFVTATKHIAIAAVAFVILVFLFHETSWAIVSTWYESNAFNHGFLILPICCYLAWRQRAKAAETPVSPDLKGLLVVAASVASWLVGKATGTLLVQEMSLVLVVQGVFLTMYGWRMWRTFRFPLLYLFFAVPVGLEIVPRLQAITAALAVNLIRDVGIPVFNDGNVISVPTGTFFVAEECSGVRFLTASLAVGALFAGISYRAWWRRILFMVLSATVPIAANGFRAFGIILLTYLTNNEIGHGVDHITYGWIFFTLVTFVLLAIGASFRERIDADPPARSIRARTQADFPLGRVLGGGFAALALAAATSFYGATIDHQPLGPAPSLVLPGTDNAWHAVAGAHESLPPIFAAPDLEREKAYSDGAATVYVDIGYYLANRRGAQIVSSDHKIGEGHGWIVASSGVLPVDVGKLPVSVQYHRSVTKGAGHVTWYWYWIDDRFTGNPYLAKLLETKVKLLGGDPRAAIVAVSADYGDNSATADRALREFASTMTWLGGVLREKSGQ